MRLAEVAPYAGVSVMIPVALVVTWWILISVTRPWKALFWWGVTLFVSYTSVIVTKLLFKGWGVGLESLNITVISGHAMNASLMITVTLSLLSRQIDCRLRWPATMVGLLIAWWFSLNCVVPTYHPVSEAVAGALLGSLGAILYLLFLETVDLNNIPVKALVFGMILIAVSTSMTGFSAEKLLNRAAIMFSGHEKAHKHPYWRIPSESL